jgi:hypothetical protein
MPCNNSITYCDVELPLVSDQDVDDDDNKLCTYEKTGVSAAKAACIMTAAEADGHETARLPQGSTFIVTVYVKQ